MAQANTPLKYGSEFKPFQLLQELLHNHPLWLHTSEILTRGATFPLHPMSEHDRKQDTEFFIHRGNHKSALNNIQKVTDLLNEDISRGFALILPLEATQVLQNISISPLGCQDQWSINENGEFITKHRLTHDQSFPGPSGFSTNTRVITEHLPNCKYGHCLKRLINYIASLRLRHPETPIFLSKFDFDAAYRRCHLAPESALESCCILDTYLIISLRLTFGGSPCPNLWEAVGEPICDIANELIHNSQWNHLTLYDDISLQLMVPKRLPPDLPFQKALQLAVDIPIDDLGKGDIYIDDSIFVTPDIGNNIERVAKAVPLAINTVARPVSHHEPLPRKELISQKKFLAEASFEESKIILGWRIDTRNFKIQLPQNKFQAWSKLIESTIQSGKATEKQLHSIEGRLNHTAYIIPTMRHFLSRIRLLRTKAEHLKGKPITIPAPVSQDLQLCNQFLSWAAKGISLNLITFREPTVFHRSDACTTGLGGYNFHSGRAWRMKLPDDCISRAHINTLEFIATIITFWIDVHYRTISNEDCILSQTDSSSAAAWLKKSNFADDVTTSENSIRLSVARKLAQLIIDSTSCLYSQWFKGEHNNVADALSRDHHLSNTELCLLLTSSFPLQTPNGLEIYEVPQEILCWTLLMLRRLPSPPPSSQAPPTNTHGHGPGGNLSSQPSESPTTTSSWTTSPSQNATTSSVHSQQQSETTPSQNRPEENTMNQSKPSLARPPWDMWHRPSRLVTDPTQESPEMESLHLFYATN